MQSERREVLRAVYEFDVDADVVESRAEALRYEQSVEVPPSTVRDPFVQKEILPGLESIVPAEGGGFRVTLAYAPATTAHDPAQLLNVLFGNCSMLSEVRLVEVTLPTSLRRALGGPRFGIAGLRQRLGADARPLTCTAVKPMGLRPAVLADLCHTFARAGIDVIKDDHGLADHAFCPFEERVEQCQRAVEDAARETGHRALYVPNVTADPARIGRRIEWAVRCGVQAVMVAPMLIGLPTLAELARSTPELLLVAHPAFGGANRIAPAVLYGSLFRAYGADAVIFPHAGGRFAAFEAQGCRELAARLREPDAELRPSLPVPAGGMSVERVEELLGFYGRDTMLLVGGSLLEAGAALFERSHSFVRQVREVGERLRPEGA